MILFRMSVLNSVKPPLLSVADCRLREQVSHGHGCAAAVSGHPGVNGAQQSGPLPEGGARDHNRTAYTPSAGVSESRTVIYVMYHRYTLSLTADLGSDYHKTLTYSKILLNTFVALSSVSE